MTLRLIGAGLPRTGTSSLREALRRLLDAPVYHMSETFAHPEHAATWVAAIGGNSPVWDTFLAGYAAGVDAPFSNCWRDLAAAYPDAPVLLSHRGSAEGWSRSMAATVLPRTREIMMRDDRDPLVPLFRVLFGNLFSDADNPEDVIAGYERWLREVRAEIPPTRLIEWQPGDGWEPICRALGVPCPSCPSPTRTAPRTTWPAPRSARARDGDDLARRPPAPASRNEVRGASTVLLPEVSTRPAAPTYLVSA